MMSLRVLALMSAVMVGARGAEEGGHLVDRAVAVVEGRLLTQSELEFEAWVALIQAGGEWKDGQTLDEDTLRDSLDYAISVRLQNNEAEKLKVHPVEEKQVLESYERLRSRFDSEPQFRRFLGQFDVDESHLVTVLARNVRAAQILDARVRLRAQVSERDVRAYYQTHAGEFGGLGFDAIKERLRERLLGEKLKELAVLELKRVRKGAEVRLLAPWAQPKASGDSR